MLADALAVGLGFVKQQILRREQHAGRTEATLQRVAITKRSLEIGDLAAIGQSLDGLDGRAMRLRRQHQAGTNDIAIDANRAGAAHTMLAADMSPRQLQMLAQEIRQIEARHHLRIDARLGDEADFDRLVAAAHDRGLRVLLDGVFNHVGRDFAGPASWFRADHAVFEGHDELPVLDHDNPEVLAYVARVMNHWLDRGADGWRLDAAYAIPPSFLHAALGLVRSQHPDAWFVGEVIHGPYPEIMRAAGLDAITQYELWKAVWSSLNDRNLFELAWAALS